MNVPYDILKKNDPFIVKINGKDYVYIKFSNAWAKPEKSGNWLSMLSTEIVEKFENSGKKFGGIEAV